ncbi:autotransporter domain-containing protein [Phyllobacterium sp. 21LDTY02-6]|uniref:autotransporter domain-containing protein n=1 Tax=Phyllobacterium sp. 21LDTY02-6 TaxID=2944903 RepID=UPI002021E7B5|nr:autotransporter domain-containing protein [Phyllobacterium sp. 21LDTY02-6]MCO4317934.1 autotransporter domain-containing protein [Phyllobacterium sp. 21LDTY02-6]
MKKNNILYCTTILFSFLAGITHGNSAEDSIKILTYNVDFFATAPLKEIVTFFLNGKFDVIALQEVYILASMKTALNEAQSVHTYRGAQPASGDAVISRLPGIIGTNTPPGASTFGDGRHFIVDGTKERPETTMVSVHLNPGRPTSRLDQARQLVSWAGDRKLPTFLVGDFNAGDVSEQGLPQGATYPKAGNEPTTLNTFKHQYQLVQTDSERELFESHALQDGRYTWPTMAGDGDIKGWNGWDRVKIDHIMPARPFAKWYVINDRPDDQYVGIIDKPERDGKLSDHALFAHNLRWVGPILQKYDETAEGEQYKVRLAWNGNASTFAENAGIFHLTRNNLRRDVYLGQIVEKDSSNPPPLPIIPNELKDLTEAEKKTLLDCAGGNARYAKSVQDYCIDDHSFIDEVLVADNGTVVVTEDAALGPSSAKLRLDKGKLRIDGSEFTRLGRDLAIEAGGGTLDISDKSNNVTLSSGLSGSGELFKAGPGRLTVDGDFAQSFTGTTVAGDGMLTVNGTLGGLVDVRSHLNGVGTVAGLHVSRGGTVSPGNSVGEFHVRDDAIFESGSTLDIEIAADKTTADRILVGKTATINGGTVAVRMVDEPALLSEDQIKGLFDNRYAVLTAGELKGTFETVTPQYRYVRAKLDYTDKDVLLGFHLVQEPAVAGIDNEKQNPVEEIAGAQELNLAGADSQNQNAVGEAVKSLGLGNPLFNKLLFSKIEDAANYDLLSGEVNATVGGAVMTAGHFASDAVTNRVRGAFGGVAAKEQPTTAPLAYAPLPGATSAQAFASIDPKNRPAGTVTLWGEAYGTWSSVDGDGNASGQTGRSGGLITGLDGIVADTWRLGLMAGYGNTSLNSARGNANVDSYQMGVYAGTQWDALGLRFGVNLAQHDIESSRTAQWFGIIDKNEAAFGAQTAQFFGEVGYTIATPFAVFEPFAGVSRAHMKTEGFAEQGGPTALSGLPGTSDVTTTTLGLRASRTFAVNDMISIVGHGMLGWQHSLGDVVPTGRYAFAGGAPFTVSGLPIAEDALNLEAGLDVNIGRRTTLGLGYTGRYSTGANDNSITAEVAVRF